MKNLLVRGAVVIGALALAGAACGSSSTSPTNTGAADPAPTGGELPIVGSLDVGAPDETPATQAACLPEEPQCDEMIAIGQEPPVAVDLPIGEVPPPVEPELEPGVVSSGMPVNGGLTVTEALAAEASAVLAVQGHLYDDGSGATLCETLKGGGERYVCGGPQIAIENFDAGTVVASFIIHDGLTYSEETLTLFGQLVDGSLIVDDVVAG